MAQPPDKKPDRHYDFGRMNKWFAWSALALLLVTLWMVWDDYSKPWKRFQSEFRDLEREQLAQRAEEEQQRIDNEEISQVRGRIAEEERLLEEQRGQISEQENALVAFDKQVYAADATMRTTKAYLDEARFLYEQALQGDDAGKQEKTRGRVEELEQEWRENRKSVEALTELRDDSADQLDKMRADLVGAEKQLAALSGDLDSLLQRVSNLDKGLDYLLLNFPLMDFIEPDLKIEQVMVPGLFHDLNFTTVDRVDRCVTCHVASVRSGFDGEEWQHPYRSHPRMDLFVGASSPHPYTRFGCSGCHGGLDRAVDFARVGHSPLGEAEKEEWIEKWGWEAQPYLETPIYPAEHSEAGCFSCHAAEVWTPESEVQDIGRELVSRMGCFVCHKIDYAAFSDMPRPGPNLAKVAAKVDPAWAYKWISAPREFRPTTWMPHFFFEPNISGPVNLERQKAEIVGTVAYLWDKSLHPEFPPAPAGDTERGRQLFETVGCTGCHLLDAGAKRDDYYPEINRLHGPNLIRTGSKLSSGWLFAWIKDPRRYAADTRMPSLRLTDQEAADITAYLMSSRDPEYENLTMPEVDTGVRDELVLSYLQNTLTVEQSHQRLESMSPGEKDVYLGEQTIRKYGCWGCHDLKGFEDAKPIGVELTEEGSKPLHQFDFGHIHDVPHTRHDWIRTKMLDPRVYDEGKDVAKTYGELLKMPNFGMSEREADAVTTTVLGFTKESVLAKRRAGQSARSAILARGRKLITLYNCRGCHLVEGKGQAIRTSIEDVGMLPPNLAAEGARVQADWLFDYLHDPGQVTLRPWLTARMPTFGFGDDEVNTVVAYFASREQREPFLSAPQRPSERDLVVGDVAFNMFQCAKCHPAGPGAETAVVGSGELAPSLLLARERLRHDWVPDWIVDPQSWIAGTKMPANFSQLETGEYVSPLGSAIDAPMFSDQKRRMMGHFDSEEELKTHLSDADYVASVLRDHIWWNLGD
jgi:cytochrome c2